MGGGNKFITITERKTHPRYTCQWNCKFCILFFLTFNLNNSPMNLMLPSDRFRAFVSATSSSADNCFFLSSYEWVSE